MRVKNQPPPAPPGDPGKRPKAEEPSIKPKPPDPKAPQYDLTPEERAKQRANKRLSRSLSATSIQTTLQAQAPAKTSSPDISGAKKSAPPDLSGGQRSSADLSGATRARSDSGPQIPPGGMPQLPKVPSTEAQAPAKTSSPDISGAKKSLPPDISGSSPTRRRAMGHGEKSLGGRSLDQMPEVSRSMIPTMTGKARFVETKEGEEKYVPARYTDLPISRITPEKVQTLGLESGDKGRLKGYVKEYTQEAQKPIAAPGTQRDAQFKNLEQKLRGYAADEKVGSHFQQDLKLLRDTMSDPVLMGHRNIASPAHAMELKRLGLQPSHSGEVGQFQDDQLQGEMKRLGGGAMSTVYSGKYTLPEGRTTPDGKKTFDGVFKPDNPWTGATDAAKAAGIDTDRPRGGYRNVATTRLDEALGFRLTTQSEMAVHNNTLGSVSARAEGKSPLGPDVADKSRPVPSDFLADAKSTYGKGGKDWLSEYNEKSGATKIVESKGKYFFAAGTFRNFDYSDPGLRRDLVRLQFMDSISGQLDRHAGNYFVHMEDGKYKGLKGIDNDVSWGEKITAFSDPDRHTAAKAAIKLPEHLPPVIDKAAAKSILALDDRELQIRMGGLLTKPEMDAAAKRLALVQDHIRTKCRILKSDDEWTHADVTQLLMQKQGKGGDEHTSYLSRDMEIQAGHKAEFLRDYKKK